MIPTKFKGLDTILLLHIMS